MGAEAEITDINFPLVLPGEIMAGTVTLMNVGDESTGPEAGWFGVLIITLWDGAEYTRFMYAAVLPGETVTFDFHYLQGGLGTMPEGAASLRVVGRTWLDPVWRVDDEKVITLGEAPPPPEPLSFLPIIGSLLTGIMLIGLCLIKPSR